MASGKASYNGHMEHRPVKDFSAKLRAKLRDLYPKSDIETDPVWGDPVDEFIAYVLSEAGWVLGEMAAMEQDLNRQDLRAEQANLLRVLEVCQDKLRSVSRDLDNLLGVDADPLGCADAIGELIPRVVGAGEAISNLAPAQQLHKKQHELMVEMAIRVLRVLKQHGIAPSATAEAYFGYRSDAVQILKAIGDDVGLCRSEVTWRDIIAKVKKDIPDLQS